MTRQSDLPKLRLLPYNEYAGVNRDDPLRFYFWPIIGRLYRRRVELCLAECTGGGPLGMEFDETGEYGGLMYVGTSFGVSAASKSGVFALDTGGSASRFAGNIAVGFDIGFDTKGLFGLDMFVVGASDFGETFGLWRVASDGTATKFATTTESLIGSVVFGPEGAMYISEYSIDDKEITITRAIPEPGTLLLLGLGGLGAVTRRRRLGQ